MLHNAYIIRTSSLKVGFDEDGSKVFGSFKANVKKSPK
jgi:hypothetical protein